VLPQKYFIIIVSASVVGTLPMRCPCLTTTNKN
jgi:hypothetical protein